jgi:hypothetical protein
VFTPSEFKKKIPALIFAKAFPKMGFLEDLETRLQAKEARKPVRTPSQRVILILYKPNALSRAWWHTPVIPAPQEAEDYEFKASLRGRVSPGLKKTKINSGTIILATWEAEIGRIGVQSQPRQKSL